MSTVANEKEEKSSDQLVTQEDSTMGMEFPETNFLCLNIKCMSVFSKPVPRWVVIVSVVIVVAVFIPLLAVSCSKEEKKCSSDSLQSNTTTNTEKIQKEYPKHNITPTEDSNNGLQSLEQHFVQLSEPFCQFPFPKDVSSNMKCFVPFKGEYVIYSAFKNENRLMNICSKTDSKHHYYLHCDDDVINTCAVVCRYRDGRCNRFEFSVNYANIILLSIGNSCERYDGHFEIGSSAYYKKKKKRIFV